MSYQIIPVANGFVVRIPLSFPKPVPFRVGGPDLDSEIRRQVTIIKEEFVKDPVLEKIYQNAEKENEAELFGMPLRDESCFVFFTIEEVMDFIKTKIK